MVMLTYRLAEANDRAVPGHWEGDLIMGAGSRGAVGTLVERTTRYVLLLDLGGDKTAVNVEKTMRRAILTLPTELRRSTTWDQGAEMSAHRSFTSKTGIPIYLCDPHSPWKRGSNETTNGLIRQFLPKSTALAGVSAADLRRIQRSLNDRPHKTLDDTTPPEKLAQVVALTAWNRQAEKARRGHAIIEQAHADLKHGPLANLPSGSFQANSAWLVMAAIAFNLTRAAGCLASTFHARATTGTLRAPLINVPARLAPSGRTLRLHLPTSWRWEPAWTQLFNAPLGPFATA